MRSKYMRQWEVWAKPLLKHIRGIKDSRRTFGDETAEMRFFEVELCLRLRERLVPDWSCLDVWTLLTGPYPLPGVPDTAEARRLRAVARRRATFLNTKTSWEKWLTWYCGEEAPAGLRLYEVNLETGEARRFPFVSEMPDRVDIYDAALEQLAPLIQRESTCARAGETYLFTLAGADVRVKIPERFAQASSSDEPTLDGVIDHPKRAQERIEIRWADLLQAAAEMEQRDPAGDWISRMQRIEMALCTDHHLDFKADAFTLDDQGFHLVGMVSSGKSTLIQVLTSHLVTVRHIPVTLMQTTVTASIEMAAFLRRLGLRAAPILGQRRGDHRLKYGQAHSAHLDASDIFRPQVAGQAESEPALRWVSAPCALSGLMAEHGPIPAGAEPCTSLRDSTGEMYSCPLLPTCPVHQASVDQAHADVWVVNPASFLYTPVPAGVTSYAMRTLEAIYWRGGVFVIDETDTVQLQWDRAYTPDNTLLGRPEALLDWLEVIVATEHARDRSRVLFLEQKHLSTIVKEAIRNGNNVMALLGHHQDLVEWMGDQPRTLVSIREELVQLLATNPDQPNAGPDRDVLHRLTEALSDFASNPTNPERSRLGEDSLAKLVDGVHYDLAPLEPLLESWLSERMRVPWLAAMPSRKAMLRKFAFCVWLTAMDSHVFDLVYRLRGSFPDGGGKQALDQDPPEEYVHLVPPSPPGNLLGYQYIARNEKQGGVLKLIHCQGIGRWVLHHFSHLFSDLNGITGPAVLLTAATSWAPGSPQYHVHLPPRAILFSPKKERDAIEQSVFRFLPRTRRGVPIRVSGTWGQERLTNLKDITVQLASPGADGTSLIERELEYWQARGPHRRVLLAVGSYREGEFLAEVLQGIPSLRHRWILLRPDADADKELSANIIHRGEVEQLYARTKGDVLIAPMQAIERGFNILDDAGGALLGSAFFLVRPYPHPDDLTTPIIGVNAFATQLLADSGGKFPPEFGTNGREAIGELRRISYHQWQRRLTAQRSHYGMASFPREDLYPQVLWDMFVMTWQICGRPVRSGRPARVFFVDAAFHPGGKGYSMLAGWVNILAEYLGPQSTKPPLERQLADALYGPAYRKLQEALTEWEESH